MRIIYLHGFASAGGGRKAEELSRLFPGCDVQSPTLHVCPEAAIELAATLITPGTLLVGTSLGGFYAAALTAMRDDVRRALIINPVVDPAVRMRQHVGMNTNYKTGETFEWRERHIESLATLSEALRAGTGDRIVAACGTEDDLTDPARVRQWYDPAELKLYADDHRFGACFSDAVRDLLPGRER